MDTIYKITDSSDYNHSFVIAESEAEALRIVQRSTVLNVYISDKKKISELKKPIIILNNILPF